MNPFYIFILVVALISIGIYYYRKWKTSVDEAAKKTWPETVAECPDYWVKQSNGKCRDTLNIRTIRSRMVGTENICSQEIDFNTSAFTGTDGNLNKCRRAKNCGFSWEGIDNLCTNGYSNINLARNW